jgi:4-aminobutyrate aminotransferase-like enzyme/Ser/Thr protein kinase RdoA (MazF antagonist)
MVQAVPERAMPAVHFVSPTFSPAQAEEIALDRFGLGATATGLPSERDQNFLLRAADGRCFVLKLSHAHESLELLEMEQAALAHLGRRVPDLALPRIAPSATELVEVAGTDGHRHLARLLTFVPGQVYATARPHDRRLLASLGEALAALGRGLADFRHPAASRDLKWDLSRATWIEAHLDALPEGCQRERVRGILEEFRSRVRPCQGALRRQVCYNDANDNNVLVEDGRVVGFVDFGDMVEGPLVHDLAIACAYGLMGQAAPLDAACAITGAYHRVRTLEAQELDLLWTLIQVRLAVSVTNSAIQAQSRPDDAYQTISEAPAWDLLDRMAAIHPRRATYALRAACGLPAHPHTTAVTDWLGAPTTSFAALMDVDPRREPCAVLDLSVGSLDLGGGDRWTMEDLEILLQRKLAETGARLGAGRYLEPRLLYPFGTFQDMGLEREEPRTVHLGADLFRPSGSPVFAPLEGTVASLADNAIQGDYGPTIILEHRAGETPFFTLYGHLDPDCLERLRVGQAVAAGERIARVGARPRNGDWTPHVHFQILLDLLDGNGDFPGVARPSDLDLFAGLCPDPNLLLGIPQSLDARPQATQDLLDRRTRGIGPSLSISYREPLHLVRGFMQHLYDAQGRQYLDLVNNVPHVGHANPRVVAAASRQLAVLNTNSRYLHELMEVYAERLCATLPGALRVCYFVNSGSEANDLALRLARTATGRKGTVVLDAAYHGNTQALIEASPYKHDGPGGAGAPPWVQKVALPDPYRGPFRGTGTGPRYAALLEEAMDLLAERGYPVGTFLVESMPGCGGQIVLPEGYLCEAFTRARYRGALCLADEVQVGLGRAGSAFWAFETQGVVPDIVTMGKPLGNGWPLGAVVTTPEIASAFANGMEYFNTFGGNPASLAAGLAVLDELRDRDLQAPALDMGCRIQDGLRELQARFPVLGDVRGLGLYIGAELVRDPATREPHPTAAAHVAERLKDLGILVSTDGPGHNVLKLKPPLVVNAGDVDRLLETLERVLAEDGARE